MVNAVRLLKRRWWWLIIAMYKRVCNGIIRRIMQRRDWCWVVRCLWMGEHALRAISACREITARYHSCNFGRREIPWAIWGGSVATWLRLGRWIVYRGLVSRGLNGRKIRVGTRRRRRGIEWLFKVDSTLSAVTGLMRGNAARQRFILREM